MMCAASKRRVCSFDMAEVPPEGYVLAEEQGEMFFCNAPLSLGAAFCNKSPTLRRTETNRLRADHALG
jgi:hypothetical protein